MRMLLVAVGTALLAGATQVHAADVGTLPPTTGGYFSIAGGWNHINNGNATAPNQTPSAITFNFNDGLAASGTAGYHFGAFRSELELSYRANGLKSFNTAGLPVSGHQDDLSLMANALFDFSTGTQFTPYIGVGVGATMLWWREFVNSAGTQLVRDTGGTKLAFQAIFGLSYAFSSEWQATADVRYKGSAGHTFTGLTSTTNDFTGLKIRDVTAMVGVRYNFGR